MGRYRFLTNLCRERLPLGVLLLLTSFTGAAEATTCVMGSAVPVKEIAGLVTIESPLDHEAGDPLPGAYVGLFKETPAGWVNVAETITDKEGKFHMAGIRTGLYTIRWERVGFIRGEAQLRVRRFARRNRIVLVLTTDVFGCGSWLELRKAT